nr:hypothetical protein [Tanacetum cinerariifolium]
GGREARPAAYSQAVEGGGRSKASRCEAGGGEAGAAVGEGVRRRGWRPAGWGGGVRDEFGGAGRRGGGGDKGDGRTARGGAADGGEAEARPWWAGKDAPLVPAPWTGPARMRGRRVVRRPRADEGVTRSGLPWWRGLSMAVGVVVRAVVADWGYKMKARLSIKYIDLGVEVAGDEGRGSGGGGRNGDAMGARARVVAWQGRQGGGEGTNSDGIGVVARHGRRVRPPRATATTTNATTAGPPTVGHQGHPPPPPGRHHTTDDPRWASRSANDTDAITHSRRCSCPHPDAPAKPPPPRHPSLQPLLPPPPFRRRSCPAITTPLSPPPYHPVRHYHPYPHHPRGPAPIPLPVLPHPHLQRLSLATYRDPPPNPATILSSPTPATPPLPPSPTLCHAATPTHHLQRTANPT